MISNYRDLGGIHTINGKRIREKYLIRSANLSQAKECDLQDARTIIDLRTSGEKDRLRILYMIRR